MLSSHTGMAQQSEVQITAAVPMPDTTLPPPITAKDLEPTEPTPAPVPADTATSEPKEQDAAPPAAEPAKDATAPATDPAKAAAAPVTAPPPVSVDSAVTEQLREMITGKQLDRLFRRKTDRVGGEQVDK